MNDYVVAWWVQVYNLLLDEEDKLTCQLFARGVLADDDYFAFFNTIERMK